MGNNSPLAIEADEIYYPLMTEGLISLNKLKPGLLPYPIFVQIARLTVLSTVELVAFLKLPKQPIKVFLSQRSKNDEFWPEMWHVPGSILRPTDKNYEDALNRVIIEDLAGTSFLKPPTFFRNNFRHEARGVANSIQYLVLLKEKPKNGKLFSIKKLPSNIVSEHVETILAAYENISRT